MMATTEATHLNGCQKKAELRNGTTETSHVGDGDEMVDNSRLRRLLQQTSLPRDALQRCLRMT